MAFSLMYKKALSHSLDLVQGNNKLVAEVISMNYIERMASLM
jgi:hypothetical protein